MFTTPCYRRHCIFVDIITLMETNVYYKLSLLYFITPQQRFNILTFFNIFLRGKCFMNIFCYSVYLAFYRTYTSAPMLCISTRISVPNSIVLINPPTYKNSHCVTSDVSLESLRELPISQFSHLYITLLNLCHISFYVNFV